jgi:hypothetical protein
MDAVSHPETQAHLRLLRGGASPKVAAPTPAASATPGVTPVSVKRMAMDAIKNVETVAQAGGIRLGIGVAVYVAHIRQVDRENKREAHRDTFPRPYNAARHTYGRDSYE